MGTETTTLAKLIAWFRKQCDGDWEHGGGITIETLDNPGWAVTIDISHIDSSNKFVVLLDREVSDTDWIMCKLENNSFVGRSDPDKLEAVLDCFFKLSF